MYQVDGQRRHNLDYKTVTIMYKKHTTQTGEKMLIASMSDQHLENTINLILEKLQAINNLMDGTEKYSGSPSQLALRGIRKSKLNFDDLANRQRDIMNLLYPYLAEAFLRGMNNKPLQQALGRTGQDKPMTAFESQLLSLGKPSRHVAFRIESATPCDVDEDDDTYVEPWEVE